MLAQVFFGLHYVAAKLVLQHVPPRPWAAIRVTSAALLLLLVTGLARRPKLPSRGDLGRLALYSLFGVTINQIFFVEGLSRTTPLHSSLMNTTIPVGTLLFAVLAGRERITGWKTASLLAALGGVALVIRPERAMFSEATAVGDVLTLVNALSYALFLVLSKDLLSRTDPLGAAAALMALGAPVVVLAGSSQIAAFDPSAVPAHVWWTGLFIVIFPTAGAYLINYWALARVESSFVALFICLQPLIAAGVSAAWTGELPGAREIAGGALVFLSVYLAMPPVVRARPPARGA